MNRSDSDSTLITLGAGVALGAGGLILALKFLPFLAFAGAGYLIYKGMESTINQETTECATGPQEK